jgi:hypothetical protein
LTFPELALGRVLGIIRISGNCWGRIADVAEVVSVLVLLARIGHKIAVVKGIQHPVTVDVLIAVVALSVTVPVLLTGVSEIGAVVLVVSNSVAVVVAACDNEAKRKNRYQETETFPFHLHLPYPSF